MFSAFRRCDTPTEFFRQQKPHRIMCAPGKAELGVGITTPLSKDYCS